MIVWLTPSADRPAGERQLDLAQDLPAGRAERRGRLDRRRRHAADAERGDPDRRRDRVDQRRDRRRRAPIRKSSVIGGEVGERRHDLHDVEDRREERRRAGCSAPAEDPEREADQRATITTAASISASVAMLASHRPRTPSDGEPGDRPSSASRQPPKTQPSAPGDADDARPAERARGGSSKSADERRRRRPDRVEARTESRFVVDRSRGRR